MKGFEGIGTAKRSGRRVALKGRLFLGFGAPLNHKTSYNVQSSHQGRHGPPLVVGFDGMQGPLVVAVSGARHHRITCKCVWGYWVLDN
jgi:hypothetical protein